MITGDSPACRTVEVPTAGVTAARPGSYVSTAAEMW
jgi:hypothetical protein